jgi:hypothetical protein
VLKMVDVKVLRMALTKETHLVQKMVKYLVQWKAQNLELKMVEVTVSRMALTKATHLVQKMVPYLVLWKAQNLMLKMVEVTVSRMALTKVTHFLQKMAKYLELMKAQNLVLKMVEVRVVKKEIMAFPWVTSWAIVKGVMCVQVWKLVEDLGLLMGRHLVQTMAEATVSKMGTNSVVTMIEATVLRMEEMKENLKAPAWGYVMECLCLL